MKNLSAYLTVYVSLTLTVVTSFCLVLIEGVRQSTIRTEVECAMDVGLNSIFAEFNKELFNRYNLFYIDTSYGTSLPSYLKTQNHLDNYLRCNLSQPTYLQQFYILDFLKLDIESISISKVARATDNNGYNLRKNIMNAIKDDYGIVSIEMLADWYKSMEKEIDFESLNEDTLETRNENLELENWNDYNEISAILSLQKEKRKGILEKILDDPSTISERSVDINRLTSARWENNLINKGNVEESDQDNLITKIMLIEYIMNYCANYFNHKDDSVLCYQIEYLLNYKNNDIDNLRKTIQKILLIREVMNCVYLMSDEMKMSQIKTVTNVIASIIMQPEIQPALEILIISSWAYIEALSDCKNLLNNNKVAFIKTDETWQTDIKHLWNRKQANYISDDYGLHYTDYLKLLLYLTNIEELTFRLMDLIEMDIKEITGNHYFRMDGCVDYIEVIGTFVSQYNYEVVIKRDKHY